MNTKQKRRLLQIITAAVLLIVVSLLPLEGQLRAAAFLLPYLAVGLEVLLGAVRGIAHGGLLDENFLMAAASVGAYATGEYSEAVAVMLLYQIGELFQSLAVGKSRKSISALMELRPDSACVLRNGTETVVPPEEVRTGETLVVRPGEKIPLDGTVLKGYTTVNTAALTGESLPRELNVGEKAVSGWVNLTGVITMRASGEFAESTAAKILELVESSSEKKAKAESFITRFAKYYTPCVVAAAVLLAVIPTLLGGSFGTWFYRALTFLVVSCPCALVISVPLAFFGGIGGASRRGILIKGGECMETLAKAKTVAFDKTGTLTRGKFEVTAVHPEKISEEGLLSLAAAAESHSNHPIAEALTAAYSGEIPECDISEITELAGLGIEAVIRGKKIYIGNSRLMEQQGAAWHNCHRSGTVIHLSHGAEYLGHIVINDEIKPEAAAATAELTQMGVARTVMLTGDRREIAEAVANKLNITEVHAELMPADKVAAVEGLLGQNGTVAFVGDGINDAPVLARADIGIAMGAMGSDAAIEAADVVLMDDKPTGVSEAVKISRKTVRIARQNIVFSLAVKATVLLLGALGAADMRLAIAADVGVMLAAVLNSMRTLKTGSKFQNADKLKRQNLP